MQNQNTYSLNTGDQQEDNNNLALTHGGLKKSLVPYDSLQRYLHEIGRYELLTREEESELARRYKEENDVEAGHRLVRANLRLVVKIAMGFFRLWSQKILDLIQEGNLGLVQALQKFDPYRGVKFSYYAAFWIRAYMLKFLMDNWRLVKIGTTQDQRKLFFRLSKERELLESRGFEAEPRLLAQRLEVKEADVIEMSRRLASPEASLDAPRGDESRETFSEAFAAPEEELDEKIYEKARREAFDEKVKEYRAGLTGRRAFIFDQRIMREDPMTLEQIGKVYDISRERVRQIENHILNEMKKEIRKDLPEYAEENPEAAITDQG
jgi:RNA polymerase sigma-32 factor